MSAATQESAPPGNFEEYYTTDNPVLVESNLSQLVTNYHAATFADGDTVTPDALMKRFVTASTSGYGLTCVLAEVQGKYQVIALPSLFRLDGWEVSPGDPLYGSYVGVVKDVEPGGQYSLVSLGKDAKAILEHCKVRILKPERRTLAEVTGGRTFLQGRASQANNSREEM